MKLVWFLNNLRVADNEALTRACDCAEPVCALYCFDPLFFCHDRYGFPRTGNFRAQFLRQSLQDLARQLEALNIPLLIARGESAHVLAQLMSENTIREIYLQREWTRDERQLIDAIKAVAASKSVPLKMFYDQFLIHPDDLPFASIEALPEVFTSFRKTVEQALPVRPPLPAPQPRPRDNFKAVRGNTRLPTLPELGLSMPSPDPRTAFPFSGGAAAGHARIQDYFWRSEHITRYKQTRNGLIGTEYSSKLSPWLANGSLSAREIYRELKAFEHDVTANEDTYWLQFELLWRDYFKYISLKHGDRLFALGGIRDRDYEWHLDRGQLEAWIEGRTPYDFVNANMRELATTGWMSNRGRQNVASYWARELQQDWRAGAAWFESQLLDYDAHSNYGNWMYNSGVGNDPRDRRFDIERQASLYDPDRRYRMLWLSDQPRSS